jgi:hypothetical protein
LTYWTSSLLWEKPVKAKRQPGGNLNRLLFLFPISTINDHTILS